MAKRRKLTPNLHKKIIEFRKSRNKLEEYEFNFFRNYYEICKFMHYQITSKIPKKLFSVAYRQYFVFLVSSIETFFRDAFVYLISKDKNLIQNIVQELSMDEGDINKLKSDEEVAEFLSTCINFQNYKDINFGFSKIAGVDFWKELGEYEIQNCVIKEATCNFSLNSFCKKWHRIINDALEIRHKVIHDANYRPKEDIKFVQKAESIFLLIPQVFTHYFSKKFKLPYIELTLEDKTYAFLFIVEDVLSEDWAIAKNNEPGLRHTSRIS